MPNRDGNQYLRKSAANRALVKQLKDAKNQTRDSGEAVILHKFVKQVNDRYKYYKFHAELTKELQSIIDDRTNRLIIQCPPRHGKTMLASKLFPAAYLKAHPDRWVGLVSYSGELAENYSRACRSYYRDAGGLVDPERKAVNEWATQGEGGLWAAGVGGVVSGRAGHLLIIDDPIKNREDADSPGAMNKLWEWFTSTLYTRLEPEVGAIVVIHTRWSENDLIGRLLEQELSVSESARQNWRILDLPAICEDAGIRPKFPEHCYLVPDWREPGEALCPQRYTVEDFEKMRELSAKDFASLYQQRPSPEGGNMFNPTWWMTYGDTDDLPLMDRVMVSLDCTFTKNDDSDYVVATVVGQQGNNYYVLDVMREKTDIIGTIAMIARAKNRYDVSGILIELAANGFAVYQILSKKVPGIIGFKPDKSKVARASGVIPIVESGNVWLPRAAVWLDVFMSEFSVFPAGKNDDMVDSLTMAINYMTQRSSAAVTEVAWGRGSYFAPELSFDRNQL